MFLLCGSLMVGLVLCLRMVRLRGEYGEGLGKGREEGCHS